MGSSVAAWDHFRSQVLRTLKSADRDAVHDLRVSARRLNQALAVFENPRESRELRRGLKDTISFAGSVRDYDIAAKLIGKLRAPLRLQARLKRRREENERALLDFLRDRMVPITGADPAKKGSAGDKGMVVLMRAIHRLFDRGELADGKARDLHKLRIAAKKLRYTMELVAPDEARLEHITSLQSKLGDIHDYESARRLVTGEGASQRIVRGLKERQQKKMRQFRRFWNDQFAGREKDWINALHHTHASIPSKASRRDRHGARSSPGQRKR